MRTDLARPSSPPRFSVSHGMGGKSVSTEGPLGTRLEAGVQGPRFTLEGDARAKVGRGGLDVDVDLALDASLVKAGATVTKDIPFVIDGEQMNVRVQLQADGEVAARGDLRLKLELDPHRSPRVTLLADGFVGARGNLTGSVLLTGNGQPLLEGQARLTLAAGAGAHASLDVGFSHFEAEAFAAAGAGVGFGLSGRTHPANIARLVPELVGLDRLAEKGKDVFENVVDRSRDAFLGAADRSRDALAGVAQHSREVYADVREHLPLV